MDIHQVRRRFQTLWNFSVLTNYNVNLSTAYYSLQQGSLTSDDMLLYVTSKINPELNGSLIELQNQKWIVATSFKELVNQDLYEYRLYPITDTFILKTMETTSNALGVNIVSDTGVEKIMNCYIEEYSLKERTVPTAQPVESYQQSFIIAANELPDYRGTYELTYKGHRYKIDSFERSVGLIKIRATENL